MQITNKQFDKIKTIFGYSADVLKGIELAPYDTTVLTLNESKFLHITPEKNEDDEDVLFVEIVDTNLNTESYYVFEDGYCELVEWR